MTYKHTQTHARSRTLPYTRKYTYSTKTVAYNDISYLRTHGFACQHIRQSKIDFYSVRTHAKHIMIPYLFETFGIYRNDFRIHIDVVNIAVTNVTQIDAFLWCLISYSFYFSLIKISITKKFRKWTGICRWKIIKMTWNFDRDIILLTIHRGTRKSILLMVYALATLTIYMCWCMHCMSVCVLGPLIKH